MFLPFKGNDADIERSQYLGGDFLWHSGVKENIAMVSDYNKHIKQKVLQGLKKLLATHVWLIKGSETDKIHSCKIWQPNLL